MPENKYNHTAENDKQCKGIAKSMRGENEGKIKCKKDVWRRM